MLRDLQSNVEKAIGTASHGSALCLAFSPDGRALVSADRLRITVWDPIGQNPQRNLTNHWEQVLCVAFSPDGRVLASASGDQTIKLWDAQTWMEIATLKGHEHEVYSVAFSADGRLLISSGKDDTVRVWSLRPPTGPREALVVSNAWNYGFGRPSRDRLLRFAPRGDTATFLDLTTLEETAPQRVPASFRSAAAVAMDGTAGMAALGLESGSIELWKTEPFLKTNVVTDSTIPPTEVATSQTGRWLAVQRNDQTTEVWDIKANRLSQRLGPMPAPVRGDEQYEGLSFWARDRYLVRASLGTKNANSLLEVVPVAGGKRCLIRPTHQVYRSTINNFAITEDGTLLATAGWDGRVKLWDPQTGAELQTLTGQLIGFIGLTFSEDGSRLAAGGWDGTITIWEVASRQRVCSWKAHQRACSWLRFVQGDRILASAGESMPPINQPEIRLWRTPSREEIAEAEAKEKTEIKHP